MRICILTALMLVLAFAAPSGAEPFYVSWNSPSLAIVNSGGVQGTFGSGLSSAEGLAFDTAGNLYVAEIGNNRVTRFAPNGTSSLFASGFATPFGVVFNATGNLFVSSRDGNRIDRVSPAGVVTPFVAGLDSPEGMAFG